MTASQPEQEPRSEQDSFPAYARDAMARSKWILDPNRIESITEYCRLANITLAPAVRNDRFLGIMNALTGLSSETGELNEIFKKVFFHGHPLDEATELHVKKELGDLMWYVALMCWVMNFDPADVLGTNIQKLRARYPDGFSTERSMNRAEGDI